MNQRKDLTNAHVAVYMDIIEADLRGMTAVAANGTLANLNLNVKIVGNKNYLSGKGVVVYSQSVEPGEVVEEGTVIEIIFKYPDDGDMT